MTLKVVKVYIAFMKTKQAGGKLISRKVKNEIIYKTLIAARICFIETEITKLIANEPITNVFIVVSIVAPT